MGKQKVSSRFSTRRFMRSAGLLAMAVVIVPWDRCAAFTTPSPAILPRPMVVPSTMGSNRGMESVRLWATPDSGETGPKAMMMKDEENSDDARQKSQIKAVAPKSTRKSLNPEPALVSFFKKAVNDPKGVGGGIAAAALAFALMFSTAFPANAAMSGGRMGGSFSAPRQSYSRPAPSTSRSFGRGYSSGYRSGFGSGYSSGIYSPGISPISPFYNPFYSPFSYSRPFFFGGPGAVVYGRGPSFLDLVVFGGISFLILNAIRSATAGGPTLEEQTSFWTETATSALGSGTSTVQISVALDVPNRNDRNSILSVLDRLASSARTDSRIGIQNLTSQVALELLRRKSSIVSASTRYKHFGDRNKAQRDFNNLSVKERGKFEKELVSKYGGVDYGTGSPGASASDSKATMAVVTIVLAIDGDQTKVPTIGSIQDVEDALRKISANAKVDDCLQSAEILWTPEGSETLSVREVVADYPELRSV